MCKSFAGEAVDSERRVEMKVTPSIASLQCVLISTLTLATNDYVQWNAAADELGVSEPGDMERIIHRSHRFVETQLRTISHSVDDSLSRVRRNLDSCVEINSNMETRYYDDEQLSLSMERVLDGLNTKVPLDALKIRRAWGKLRNDRVLKNVFILQVDLFRLGIVWLQGGWWLDADVVCLDGIEETLYSIPVQKEIDEAKQKYAAVINSARLESCEPSVSESFGCVWAWEGSVPSPSETSASSSPLNWAFGCSKGHPFLVKALSLASERILAWDSSSSPVGIVAYSLLPVILQIS